MRDKRFTRQQESLLQPEPAFPADEQARLLNDPPISFGKIEHGPPVEKK